MTYRKLCQRNLAFQRTIIGPLKSKMAEIRHLENRHDVIFLCWGWSDLDNISQTGAEWHVDCGDMVKMETRCRIPIWRTFGWIQWHVIPEPRITLQGATTWWIHCHDSRATCHIAGCKNSVRRTENPFSPYFILFFLFLMQFKLWRFDERRLSYRLRYTCLIRCLFSFVFCFELAYYCFYIRVLFARTFVTRSTKSILLCWLS